MAYSEGINWVLLREDVGVVRFHGRRDRPNMRETSQKVSYRCFARIPMARLFFFLLFIFKGSYEVQVMAVRIFDSIILPSTI